MESGPGMTEQELQFIKDEAEKILENPDQIQAENIARNIYLEGFWRGAIITYKGDFPHEGDSTK